MTTTNFRKAIRESIARTMRNDPTVVLLGEDVGKAGGAFKTTVGLFEEFGPRRVFDTPISEQAIIGAAIGAAVRGLKPIAEIMFADFLGTCWDGIANHAAKMRYMSNGTMNVPMVIRTHGGAGFGFGAQHSQTWENLAMSVPGLKVVMPSSPADHVGLLQSAVDDPDPVLLIEHKGLFSKKGELPEGEFTIPLGKARVDRLGADVTLVTVGAMLDVGSEAAAILARDHGVDVELVDLRSLWPLDTDLVVESVSKTGRLLLLEEASGVCGWSSEVSALVAEHAFGALDSPIRRIRAPHTPVPFAANLESAWRPGVHDVIDAIIGQS